MWIDTIRTRTRKTKTRMRRTKTRTRRRIGGAARKEDEDISDDIISLDVFSVVKKKHAYWESPIVSSLILHMEWANIHFFIFNILRGGRLLTEYRRENDKCKRDR